MRTGKIITGYGIIQRDIMRLPISIHAKAVYCLLVAYTGNKEVCYPSLRTISENLRISKPTVLKAISELEANRLVVKSKKQHKSGLYENNIYEPLYILEQEGVVKEVDHGGKGGLLGVVKEVDTKNNTLIITDINNVELPSATTTVVTFNDKCLVFIQKFNELLGGKRYKATKQVCDGLKNRMKTYKASDILKALRNAMQDDYHKETGYKHLQPMFFLRSDEKIEKFLNTTVFVKEPNEPIIPQQPVNHNDRV